MRSVRSAVLAVVDAVAPRDLSLAGNCPEYRELQERRDALGARAAQIYERLREIGENERIERAKSSRFAPTRPVTDRVAKLLGDEPAAAGPGSAAETGALQVELRDIAEAQEILQQRMGGLRGVASQAALAKVEPELRDRVRRVAAAMKTLGAEYGGLLDLVDEMNANDLAWAHLGPPHALFLQDPRRADSRIPIWLKQMAGYGWI